MWYHLFGMALPKTCDRKAVARFAAAPHVWAIAGAAWDVVLLYTQTPFNMATTQRQLTKQSVKNIMNSRMVAPASLVGKKVTLVIEGNGAIIDVKNSKGELVPSISGDGTVFQKKIFNTKANSGIAMASTRNAEYLKAGLAFEKAGDMEKAHEQYNLFLRAVQLDFSVPTNSPVIDKLANGVEIGARLIEVKTERGSLLTIDPATISVLEPAALAKTTFDFEEEDEQPAATASEIGSLKA